MSGAHVDLVLKADALGRVERVVGADGTVRVRRVACGGTIPGSRFVARRLLAREEKALRVLDGFEGVPRLIETAPGTLERSWIEGAPLSRAESLPEDFFDRLDDLVRALHARGVCHNDLHKEQNVLVAADGWPALLDFQLASVHRSGSSVFASRARDDLRHVEKHRRRYTRDGRGPAAALESRGAGHGIRRSPTAYVWRRTVKPAYVFVTRRLLATRDGEARRESSGPWPRWTAPLRPRG
jgi:RIO-like serine/threonine protein kinase